MVHRSLTEVAFSGMALAPFRVLAGGKLRTDEEEEARRASGEKGRTVFGPWERTQDEKIMSDALEKVAKEVGTAHISAGPYPFFFKIHLPCRGAYIARLSVFSRNRLCHAEGQFLCVTTVHS